MQSITEQITSEQSTIAIMILAAGASTRMGTPKQLLLYQGRSLIQYITEIAIASVCQPIIVVLGAHSEQIRLHIDHLPVCIVENLNWANGMGSSISSGMRFLYNLPQNIEAVVIVLCDQPFLSTQLINQLVDAYHSTKKPMIVCEYAETLGVPALFDKIFFSELAELQGNTGAKKIIHNHLTEVFTIPFAQGSIDIDIPKDYQQLDISKIETLCANRG